MIIRGSSRNKVSGSSTSEKSDSPNVDEPVVQELERSMDEE